MRASCDEGELNNTSGRDLATDKNAKKEKTPHRHHYVIVQASLPHSNKNYIINKIENSNTPSKL